MTELSLPEKVVAIDVRLAEARVAHAFGGALALAYYAEPRATIDVDLNLFSPADTHPEVARALAPLGVATKTDPALIARDGQCRWWWGRTPIDLFFAYDPLHDAMRDSVRLVPFGDERIPILGPEHLIVCKVIFDRPKDWLDIEQVLVCNGDLDLSEIRNWLDRIAGPADPRSQHFADLAARG